MTSIKKTTLSIWTSVFGLIIVIGVIFLIVKGKDHLIDHFD
jgi:hypothetical protein